MKEHYNAVAAQLRNAKVIMEQTEKRTKALEETLRTNDVKAYIFEKRKDVKHVKNALVERLLSMKLKTTDEVDTQVPIVKASIEKLLMEVSGGRGLVAKDEPIGSDAKKLQVKVDGKPTTLTESELRQRELAGLPTELVEQAK